MKPGLEPERCALLAAVFSRQRIARARAFLDRSERVSGRGEGIALGNGRVNRSLLIRYLALALGVAAGLGVVYRRLTQAAPSPASSAAEAQAPRLSVSAAPLLATVVSPIVSASPDVVRLDARRQLYESVDALVQASEFERARKLLDEDQERYGDDLAPEWHDLEQSYRLIADCLEHPTPKLRVRAEAFVLVSQALSLRPRILAACKPTP